MSTSTIANRLRGFRAPQPEPKAGGSRFRIPDAVGALPLLLVVMIVTFAILEPRFMTGENMINVGRQATFLLIVALAQMLVLISGGFDLSVGSIIALTSVVTATVMIDLGDQAPALAIAGGAAAGLGVALVFGAVNGICVAALRVNPFIVTLATASVGFGVALLITGGSPVSGLPREYLTAFGTKRILDIPVPVFFGLAAIVGMYLCLNWTRFGRYVYAIGSNERAARLSGIRVPRTLLTIYAACGLLTGVAGVLLTARVSTGDANLGGEFVLQSIAAAVLGGVSLRGGEGRVSGVVMGALFIALLSNGMNLIRVSSFYQLIVLGVVLIGAVVLDQARRARA